MFQKGLEMFRVPVVTGKSSLRFPKVKIVAVPATSYSFVNDFG